MCGRYSESKRTTDVRARIAFDRAQIDLMPRYNIAPTQQAPVVVVQDGAVLLKPMRWGLIPFWAKDESIGNRMINARSESVMEKAAFRRNFERRRCLVVADSFYEWKKLPNSKLRQPMRILLRDESVFAFAGLWDRWRQPNGSALETFTIITGEANQAVVPIHDRMPVILPTERHEQWLDPKFVDMTKLAQWLAPYPASEVKTYPVSTLVNDPKCEDAKCIEPFDDAVGPNTCSANLDLFGEPTD
jgi:putative SOS response-associated peptidase YedK